MRSHSKLAMAIITSLFLVAVLGCHPDFEFIYEKGHPRLTPQWSPDGVHIVFSRTLNTLAHDVYLSASDGTMLRQVLKPEPATHRSTRTSYRSIGTYYSSPDISPDGSRIVYATTRIWESYDPEWTADWEIETSRLDGSDRRRLTVNATQDTSPVWSPDGSRIAFMRDGLGLSQTRGVSTMSPGGSYQRLLMRFREANPHEEDYGDAYITDTASEGHSLSWSPNGKMLAFVIRELDQSPSDIPRTGVYTADREVLYTMGANGSNLTRLFEVSKSGHNWIRGVAWSPDAQRVAFMTSRNFGTVELYTIGPDGFNSRLVTELEPRQQFPAFPSVSWSPDGRKILFSSGSTEIRDGLYEPAVHVVNTDGSEPYAVAEGSHASWSPDGSKIAVFNEYAPTRAAVLSTIAADGSDMRILVRRDGDKYKAENARCFLFFCW